MEIILEKFEINVGELDEKLRDVCNLSGFNHSIKFTTDEIHQYLVKNGYTIYVVNIEAQIYEKHCYDGEVEYKNPKKGIAQDIVALLPDDTVPTTEKGIGKYNVYRIFDKLMKEKLLNI